MNIEQAMKHPDKLGAGAAKRRQLPPKQRASAVMKEFGRGTLRSGSGAHVKTKAQALAIAISEKSKRKIRE